MKVELSAPGVAIHYTNPDWTIAELGAVGLKAHSRYSDKLNATLIDVIGIDGTILTAFPNQWVVYFPDLDCVHIVNNPEEL